MWRETGLYLFASNESILVQTRLGQSTVPWIEIHSLTEDSQSVDGLAGYWITLRDKEGEILAQWDRNWAAFNGAQKKREREIEDLVQFKLWELGRGPSKTAKQQEWQQLNPLGSEATLEVTTNYQWIGWVGLLFCLTCAFFSWNAPKGGPIVGSSFLFFGLLSLYLIVAKATMKVDADSIEASSLFGRSRILWGEVQRLAMDESQGNLTFHGRDKRLSFAGPAQWGSGNRSEMMLFLAAQYEKRAVPFDDRATPLITGSKNGKVR